ncbi:DUF1697 domain-containing protein [Paenibacillus lemnae]|uniref:DUF1697 domain-containing protein n=1 Tax=Paenibacillus lemnae TaxID=1330551 RepID=A0A848M4K5_PAELE|nr:DUF1697 domain-containing protein [Paenibacillus lemnae]NMO95042.1 DUF1697 domain-containing protein [Paenibacillus lemnae]
MVYTALLRGINVGGNNKVDMKQLKKVFETAGMTNVVTYINSGNIVFTSDRASQNEIAAVLEAAILEHFGLSIKVLVRSMADMEAVMSILPTDWSNDDRMKSDCLFLWEEYAHESVLEQLNIKPEIETVLYAPGAILWSVDRPNVTKSSMNKLIGTKLYQSMTVRNVNTTRKIYALMQAAGQK